MTKIRARSSGSIQDRRGGGGGLGGGGLGGIPIKAGGGMLGLIVLLASIFLPKLLGGTSASTSPSDQSGQSGSTGEVVCETEIEQVVCGAVDDVSGFCTRQPTVCDTARILLVKLEAKAKYGMRLIYQWAETPEPATPAAAGTEAKLGDPITTSTVAGDQHPAKDALRPADLRPKWRPPKRSGAG